jgi:hypothetical protein
MMRYELTLPRWDVGPRVIVGMTKTGKPRTAMRRPTWDPLMANYRGTHWAPKAAATAAVIEAVAWRARAVRIPAGRVLTVHIVWAPGDKRRRDPPNLWPLQKAAVDAFAVGDGGLGLVPDDRPPWLYETAPEIHPPPARPGVYLIVDVGDPI